MKNITISVISVEEFNPLFNKYRKEIFRDHSYSLYDLISEEEKMLISGLKENEGSLMRLRLAAYDETNNFIGWSFGYQVDSQSFYMCNSAVLEGYRQQGVYTQLLDETLRLVKEKGFQKIFSRHNTTNNAIIIPKLKKGFIINNLEIDDIFGVLIHLTYYTNPVRRQIMDYRVGQAKPTEQIQELFNK